MDYVGLGMNTANYVELCVKFEFSKAIIENNTDILEQLSKDSGIYSVRRVAEKLLLKLYGDWEADFVVAISDIAASSIGSLSISAIRTVIASYGPVGFFVNLGLDFANDLFNISEQCQYAVKTYGAAKIADAVADLLQDDLDKIETIGEFYYVRNLDLPTNFERLGLARAYAEITYISLKEKAPDLMEAMSDHTDVTRSKLVINEIRRLLNLEEDFFDRWQ